ncbi:MAG: hypothetical protein K2W97_08205 [Chthoniobacterales bacterium]|nr:hypothetical protein [Chthoniobacterales bacterium]
MNLFLLLFVAFSVVAGLLFAFIGHGLGICSAWASLMLAGMGAVVVTMRIQKQPSSFSFSKRKILFWEWFVIIVFAFTSLRSFLWLIYHDGDFIKVLSPNNLGDLSFHISLIHYLSKVTSWWPASPILIHESLRYPVGMDFFNSLLLLIGIPLEQGLIWVGLFGACITGMALWRWGRGIAIAALLFNGGLAGILVWRGMEPDTQVAWKNLFLSMFVTQRGFLFALPAGLLLLTEWKNRRRELPFSCQVFLLAVIPLFSVHTFLFLAAIMVGIAILLPEVRRNFFMLALCSWPWALLAAWMVSGGGTTNSMIAWHLGWMQEGNRWWFWIWNFGISLPLALLLVIEVRKKAARAFVWPAAAIFLSCCVIRFAPWPWDNMKLMIWSWLTIAPFLWNDLIAPRARWIQWLSAFVLFGSGFVTLGVGLDGRHGYEIARQSELAAAAALLSRFPADAVIAAAPEYNHPVLLLGHPIVAGYEGHLWSHGLRYQERLNVLRSILQGAPGWEENARAFGVSAIYWSVLEQELFPGSQLPFAKEVLLPIIYPILVP